jgi:hypothetical protein
MVGLQEGGQGSFVFLCSVVSCLIFPISSLTSTTDIELEKELRYLFSQELGHTLIGAKPVSVEECFLCGLTSSTSKERTLDFLKQIFANSNTFILMIHVPYPSYIVITLIHKPLLIKTIQHEEYLRRFLERHYNSVEKFIEILPDSEKNIFELLKFDDMALGLLFGYGYANTEYASRKLKIQDILSDRRYVLWPLPHAETITITPFCTLPCVHIDISAYNTAPSCGFHSLEEELCFLNMIEYKTQEVTPPYLFSPPFFIAKQCPETEELLRHYKKSTDKLAEIHRTQSFSRFLIKLGLLQLPRQTKVFPDRERCQN